MNEKDLRFFREATLRICGNLEIHKAMSETLKLLKEHMAIDIMYLQVYEHKLHSMRSIAEAMVSHSRMTDILIPMPVQALSAVDSWTPVEIPDVQIYDSSGEDLVAKALLEAHGIENAQVMGLSLLFKKENTYTPSYELSPGDIKKMMLEGDGMASIIVVSKSSRPYAQMDVDLLALLREPFNIAVSNAMRHMDLEEKNQSLRIANTGLKETMDLIRRIAPSFSTVLLMGETGVGKEVLAHEIHRMSHVSEGPLVTVNCGAIPEGLIESELFGHEKGAFTGAERQRIGFFEKANGGTLFLDEIGELPESAQVKLLRAIQDKRIRRVGGSDEIGCDFRLIAATNRNLDQEAGKGNFREDLWYRINMFPLRIKPLRERREDLPLLVDHFLKKKKREMNLSSVPRLSSKALDQLLTYSWPGNVRELENIIERAVILSFGDELAFDSLGSLSEGDSQKGSSVKLDDIVRSHIKMVLKETDGKIHGAGGAAEILGVNPNTLRNRMDKLGIDYRK